MRTDAVSPLSALLVLALGLAAVSRAAGDQGAAEKSSKVLRHVVLLKFKPEATAEQIKAIETAFAELPKKIDTITAFEWGIDVAPEKRSEGFTHCFLVTFATEAGRDAYLPHAAHQEFVKLLKPQLEKVLVVDYWAK